MKMTKEKAGEAILEILNDFEPEEWDELIGENSYIMAVNRGKICEKRCEQNFPLIKRFFGIDF